MPSEITKFLVSCASLAVTVVFGLFPVQEWVKRFFPWTWPRPAGRATPPKPDLESNAIELSCIRGGFKAPSGQDWAKVLMRLTELERTVGDLKRDTCVSASGQTTGNSVPSPRGGIENRPHEVSGKAPLDEDRQTQGGPANRISASG